MSGRQGRADDLRELTLDELRAAEAGSDDFDDEYLKALSALKTQEELQARLDAVEADLRKARAEARRARLSNLIYEDSIGTGTSATAHPSEGLDIVVASDLPQLIANIKALINSEAFSEGPIAFLPVRIWPLAVQPTEDGKESFGITGFPIVGQYKDKRTGQLMGGLTDRNTGEPIPNYELGRSRFQGSYACVEVLVNGRPQLVSLSGMARVSVNPFGGLDPNSLTARLDRTAKWDRWSNSDAEIIQGSSGTPAQDDEGPPFIPSLEADRRGKAPTGPAAERGRTVDRAGPNNIVEDIEPPSDRIIEDTDDL